MLAKYEKGLRAIMSNIIFGMLVFSAPLTSALLVFKGADVGASMLLGIGQLLFACLYAWTARIVIFEAKKKPKGEKEK